MTDSAIKNDQLSGFNLPEEIPTYAQVKSYLDQRNIYGLTDFFNQTQLKQIVDAFYNAEPDWSVGFEGLQFSLGEAWYYYTEGELDTSVYFDKAAKSKALVDKHIPGLQNYVLSYLQKFLETDAVHIREGWAGPGIVNFPAHNWCATNGGAVHYDTEGLDPKDRVNPTTETFSFVAMLQKPQSGGNLLVWDKPFNPRDPKDAANEPNPNTFPNPIASKIDYKEGELWMFNGLRAHFIEPFQGEKDRLCLTFHIVKKEQSWELWF